MSYWNDRPRISTDYTYKGVEAAILENRHLRLTVLPGKGGDIVEFRDKRTDVDVLWHADHDWVPPAERRIPTTELSWNDFYPGGWQVNLPIAGAGGMDFPGNHYDHHGESALLPWDAEITRDDDEAVALELSTELRRYPFDVTRELTLPADASRLEIDESITNLSEVDLEYIWQHHLALGEPLAAPGSRLDAPIERAYVDTYGPDADTARLAGDSFFEWPNAPGTDGDAVDLSVLPEKGYLDMVYGTELADGWYAVRNPDLDLGFALTWPVDPFETLWYWQCFGGANEAPFWGRNYTAGIEPTTAYPGNTIPDAQRENGTIDVLDGGDTIESSMVATTFAPEGTVTDVTDDGRVRYD
ncbi:MAG: DUF4432 family protein [Haloarculaceae archaeon]